MQYVFIYVCDTCLIIALQYVCARVYVCVRVSAHVCVSVYCDQMTLGQWFC